MLFLHARCRRNRGFYLMRFRKWGGRDDQRLPFPVYRGVAAHPLQHFNFLAGSRGHGSSVAAQQLVDSPPCPYCESRAWALCACGSVHCCDPLREGTSITLVCPWCEMEGTYESSAGGFELDQSLG